jgi:hypothetical protein
MIIAFISGFALDLAWAYYTRQVAAGAAGRAALASIATGGLGAVGITSVVRDANTLPAYLAGLALGTYVAVRWGK